jgi:hypothetical protein
MDMVSDYEILQQLVETGLEDGVNLNGDQCDALDRCLCWEEVEQHYGLHDEILPDIYSGREPMSQEVIDILYELAGYNPVAEPEGDDIWL